MSEDARVHALIVGRFGLFGPGRTRVDLGRLATALASERPPVVVTVPDNLGTSETRSLAVGPKRLKDLSLSGVTDCVPELSALAALRDALGHADVALRPAPEEVAERIQAIVGTGSLLDAARAQVGGPKATAAPPVAAGTSLLDAVLSATPAAPRPADAVSSVIASLRGSATVSPEVAKQQRALHRLIDDRLALTGAEVLRAPAVALLEAAWRGLKLVLDECTEGSGIAVDVLELAGADIAAEIEAAIPDDAMERPDFIVVADALSTLAPLTKLAELAETLNAPTIAALDPAALGADDASQLALRWEEGALPEAYQALRDDRAARWLFLTTNPVLTVAEGAGAARRLVGSSPALALGAMLLRSYRLTGAFARIGSGWHSPAVHVPSAGPAQGSSIPTAAFVSAKSQGILAGRGLVAMGSARGADEVRISTVVSCSSAPDAVPIPAQILTGRIVRMAQWIRDQLPSDADDELARSMFEQAASILVFPGLAEAASVEAKIVRDDPEVGPTLVVKAQALPSIAGVTLQVAFGLALPR